MYIFTSQCWCTTLNLARFRDLYAIKEVHFKANWPAGFQGPWVSNIKYLCFDPIIQFSSALRTNILHNHWSEVGDSYRSAIKRAPRMAKLVTQLHLTTTTFPNISLGRAILAIGNTLPWLRIAMVIINCVTNIFKY